MSLEEDAQKFLNSLEYSIGEERIPLDASLPAISQIMGQIADCAERWTDEPSYLVEAAKYAYGLWAYDVLCAWCASQKSRDDARVAPASDELYVQLGAVCEVHGQSVLHWAEVMDFFFRDLYDVAHGSAQPQTHVEQLLRLSLGVDAADRWRRICRALADRSGL